MTSLANPYFPKGVTSEQNLVQGLVTEAIQIVGHTVYYLPRSLQKLDHIFGEDILSQWTTNLPIEMYIETSAGWGGEQELISKFGLEIRKQLILSVSKERWDVEVANIASDMWITSRPQEGDLIYDPVTRMIFEIKFVDQDDQFFQLSKKQYSYKLTCEMFQFNREELIQTGIPEVDDVLKDVLSYYQLKAEDGSLLMYEDDTYIVYDDQNVVSPTFDNAKHFDTESTNFDFNVNNPFGD